MFEVDESRLQAFADAVDDARISTRDSRRRVLRVCGEPGSGKTTLAVAYAARTPRTQVIGPEWVAVADRTSLSPSMRKSLVIVDEPLFFGGLSTFLDTPGDLVVLLMQHADDVPLDVMISNSLRFDLPHWSQGAPALYR